MTTFLKRYWFDDRRLRERALVELVNAFATGRMIAFVGSMATEGLGYGGWDRLVDRYVARSRSLARLRGEGRGDDVRRMYAAKAIEAVCWTRKGAAQKKLIAAQAAMAVAREALGEIDAVDPLPGASRVERLTCTFAELFGRRRDAAKQQKEQLFDQLGIVVEPHSSIESLVRDHRVLRIATLNYDLEFEAEMMELGADADRLGALERLLREGAITRDPRRAHRLHRLLSSGLSVESDLRDRGRADRLIEFAIGSADVDLQIMHLHGRATDPQSMIVGLRDYDRLYRKDDPARLPFEHGQRILLGGNPVMFVGIGMSEPEVNATLQHYVARNPYRRFAPTFLIWNTCRFSTDEEVRRKQMWLTRTDFLQRLGVMTIFDEDLLLMDDTAARRGPERSDMAHDLEKTLSAGRSLSQKIDGPSDRHVAFRAGLCAIAKRAGYGATVGALQKDCWIEGSRVRAALEELGKKAEKRVAGLKCELRMIELSALAKTLRLMSRSAEARYRQMNKWLKPSRSLVPRLEDVGAAGPKKGEMPIALWGTKQPKIEIEPHPDRDEKLWNRWNKAQCATRVVLAKDGSGKGGLAWRLVGDTKGQTLPYGFSPPMSRRMIVNSGFAFDSDFLLHAISKFLLKAAGNPKWEDLHASREQQFNAEQAFDVKKTGALVVINGMDRFFTIGGAPLSAELDHLLRRIAASDGATARWIFLGTPRIERYFRLIAPASVFKFTDLWARPRKAAEQATDLAEQATHLKDAYFSLVTEAMQEAAKAKSVPTFGDRVVLAAHARGNALDLRRAAVGAYVNSAALSNAGVKEAGLAMEILRAMAFIGSPVELAVLLHVPRIRKLLEGEPPPQERLQKVLGDLEGLHLVIRLLPFENFPTAGAEGRWDRYGLHSAVSAGLRLRFGVPVSESKLSTSFNMSLYVAQPVDSSEPDAAIHEELRELVEQLIAVHEKTLDGSGPAGFAPPDAGACAAVAPEVSASLRAALSVIRNYYSTTSLLTLDRGDRLVPEDRDGVLLEHAERLESLLHSYRRLTGVTGAHSPPPADPFYPDDLVWILNELGVIYLAQGDLYSAGRSLTQALLVNKKYVEFEDHSHNWRRMTMNNVLLNIERASLGAAEAKLREIEASINDRDHHPAGSRSGGPTNNRDPLPRSSRFDTIRRKWGHGAPADRSCFDRKIMHEQILMVGLVLGHRGLCHHIRGHVRTAEPLYVDAIAILRRLGEHRAYAFFQRHYAQLQTLTTERGNPVALREAVTAAEAVRQMDMAYHARVVQADSSWRGAPGDAAVRRTALRHLDEALAYAARMDLYRLRVEAGLALARLKLDSGDNETALDHATEAISLAARYGLSLRKISLRLDMGHILIRRGDPDSGAALIERAVAAAARFGYQRAVEAAQRIRVEEGLSS